MSRKIIEIEDSFSLAGGLVVVGKKEENSPDEKIGALVEILRPDGIKISSQITGIEMPNFKTFPAEHLKQKIGFLLKDVSKADVPHGSIINIRD
jgi:translation elongation factor EF-Tu-like GTPase